MLEEEGGPEEPGTWSDPTYMGLSPTLMGGGMLVYSKAAGMRTKIYHESRFVVWAIMTP